MGGGPTRHFRSRPVWGWGWPRPRLRPLKSCRPPGPRSCQMARYPRTTPAISTASLAVLARRFRADLHEVGRIEGIGLAFFGSWSRRRPGPAHRGQRRLELGANSYEVLVPRSPMGACIHAPWPWPRGDQKMRERQRQTATKPRYYIRGIEITAQTGLGRFGGAGGGLAPRLRPLKSCRPPGPRSCQMARYPRTTPAISTASLPVLARRFRADPHEVGRIEGIGPDLWKSGAAATRASTSRSAPDTPTSCRDSV